MSRASLSRHLTTLAWSVLFATAAIAAYLQIFSIFMLYDDEGYVLLSLNNFARHGALYDRVYSQYGPLFYLVFGGIARLGDFSWTHDLGRFYTIGAWLTTAAASGWITHRLTRSQLAAMASFAGTFGLLWQMTFEPMHPGNTLTPVIALTAAISITAVQQRRMSIVAITLAVAAAVCAMIKINVGVFLGAAGCMWLGLNSTWSGQSSRRWLPQLLIVGGGLIPIVLMGGHLDQPWAGVYAMAGSAAIVATGRLTHHYRQSWVTPPMVFTAIGVALLFMVATVTMTMFSGSSMSGLIRGIILGPLGHADAYHHGFRWRTGTVPLTLFSWGLLTWVLFRYQPNTLSASWLKSIAMGRLGLAGLFIYHACSSPPSTVGFVMTSLAATVGWLVVPLRSKPPERMAATTLLALMLVWQFLHAFPVAGSQIGWGTFLWIPLAVVALHDAGEYLIPPRVKTIATGVSIVGVAALAFCPLQLGWNYFKQSEPLALPGAKHMRMPADLGSAIRIMTRNAALHGEQLFSLPGSYSFNLWTGLPTPNETNVTHWFTLLDNEQQNTIISQLEHGPVTTMIEQHDLVAAKLRPEFVQESPLLNFAEDTFQPVFSLGPLSFRARYLPGRVVLDGAEIFQQPEKSENSAEPILVRIDTALPAGSSVVRIQVALLHGTTSTENPAWDWSADNTRAQIIPIHPNGVTRSDYDPADSRWPLTTHGLTRWHLLPRERLPSADLSKLWLKFIDKNGAVIGEARFIKRP
ncbi:hypothetical protein [Synoicihabitans lomoniglobus]|uniref:Uncharacterized protein n=1 Tax=Synoicihabitans lomoniglobus TaxID=2909285 RepID=A0AAE9ZYT0_9BACT|nr:hypothetical protein [Opitutaceae bacterium LMO-M01]WED65744.1 hypothetical protein PXH66_02650 [Opitutaceae bacterium LMO-M01]